MPLPKDALGKLQNDSSYSKTAAEILDWTYYDTIKLLSTTLMHRFFTVQLGQSGKTLADTNLPNSSQLPQGQNLKVHAIKSWYITDAAFATADVQLFYDMLNSSTIEVVVPGKDSLGTWRLAELIGAPTLISMIPTAAGDNIPLNMSVFKGVFPLNYPIKIGAIQTFELRLVHHVAPNASLDNNKLCMGLNGRLARMS